MSRATIASGSAPMEATAMINAATRSDGDGSREAAAEAVRNTASIGSSANQRRKRRSLPRGASQRASGGAAVVYMRTIASMKRHPNAVSRNETSRRCRRTSTAGCSDPRSRMNGQGLDEPEEEGGGGGNDGGGGSAFCSPIHFAANISNARRAQ